MHATWFYSRLLATSYCQPSCATQRLFTLTRTPLKNTFTPTVIVSAINMASPPQLQLLNSLDYVVLIRPRKETPSMALSMARWTFLLCFLSFKTALQCFLHWRAMKKYNIWRNEVYSTNWEVATINKSGFCFIKRHLLFSVASGENQFYTHSETVSTRGLDRDTNIAIYRWGKSETDMYFHSHIK